MSHYTNPEEFVKQAGALDKILIEAKALLPSLGADATLKDAIGIVQSATPSGTASFFKGTLGNLPWKWVAPIGLGAAALGTLGLMGDKAPSAASNTISYRTNRGLFGLMDRVRADEEFGGSLAKGLGSAAADSIAGLARDVASKGVDTLKDSLSLSPIRHQIFNSLRKEDDILADADMKTLQEAYHTMAKIAPTLSTDKNAVKSVLRSAVMSGGGLDFSTIKGIADAEKAVNNTKAKD